MADDTLIPGRPSPDRARVFRFQVLGSTPRSPGETTEDWLTRAEKIYRWITKDDAR